MLWTGAMNGGTTVNPKPAAADLLSLWIRCPELAAFLKWLWSVGIQMQLTPPWRKTSLSDRSQGRRYYINFDRKTTATDKSMVRNRSHPLTCHQTDMDKTDSTGIMNQSTVWIEVRFSEYPSSDKHFQIYDLFLEESRLFNLWRAPWTSGLPLKSALATLRNYFPVNFFTFQHASHLAPPPDMHACTHAQWFRPFVMSKTINKTI